ncbi:DEAD/DEAH box helicase family protein, partial [Candidatus Bathyarchaeota archaeon]|nr:DEAD/DEAH box helicase family protein [Candidatus Bathyarchaeota archaeon]
MKTLEGKPRFRTSPYLHQKACFIVGARLKRAVLHLDMGTGKTKIMLDVFRYHKSLGHVKRCLVLAPTLSAIESWRLQRWEHGKDLRFLILGDDVDREAILNKPSDLVVATYMGWLSLLCREVSKGKKEWVVDEERVRSLASKFDMVVYDESTFLKNHRSLSFKVAKIITEVIPYRYGLTGTPVGKTPHDLWAQFYAVDAGETLGRTLGIFRQAFFTSKVNYWGGYEYTFISRMMSTLQRMIGNIAVSYSADECLDLPAQVFVPKPITFAPDVWPYYQKLVDKVKDADTIEIKNVFIR